MTQWSRVRALAAVLSSNNPGQVVHTHMPLSPSSIIWYCHGRWRLSAGKVTVQAWWKVMSACRRVDGLKSPAGWLPVHRDQLRSQHSVTSRPMGELYHYRSPIYFVNLLTLFSGVWMTVYLESRSTTCSRPITDLNTSCTTNRAFDAATYYTGFKVVMVCLSDIFASTMQRLV